MQATQYKDAWTDFRTAKVFDAVDCPLCKFKKGWPCRSLANGTASSTAHADRWKAYIELEQERACKQKDPIPTQNLGGLFDENATHTGEGRPRTSRNRSW